MKKFRNACWVIGFLIFCVGACCADSPGISAYIVVAVGLAVLGVGILKDVFLIEEDDFFMEVEDDYTEYLRHLQ